jgi:putative oxidoreductase
VSRFDLVLLFLRATIGLTLMAHGYNKFKGGLAGTARWFESIGVRPGRLHAPLAATTEVTAGFGLAVGALTPLSASGIIAIMVVASIAAHLRNGFFIFRPGEGWEYTFMIAVACFLIATIGPGRWSFDNAVGLIDDGYLDSWWGFVIALVVGVGSGALLLATCWRPPPRPAKAT